VGANDLVSVNTSKRESLFFGGKHAGVLWIGGDYNEADEPDPSGNNACRKE
jgi:hypothetical protein